MQKTDLRGKELNSLRLIKGFHFAPDLKINFKHASLVILLKNLHYRVLKKRTENVKLHEFFIQYSRRLVKGRVDLLLQQHILSALLYMVPFVKGINLQTHFQCKIVHLHEFPIRLLLIRSMPIDLISFTSQSQWC